jgi:exodeoxyribonuclease VII large subunit
MHRQRELLHAELQEALGRAVERLREPVRRNESMLRVLGPQSVLDRGFSMTLTEEGEVVDDPAQVPEDAVLVTRVKKGELRSRRIK